MRAFLNLVSEEVAELQQRGIGTSVHFIPLHLMSYYRQRYALRPEDFPVALRLYRAAISLPIYPSLAEALARTDPGLRPPSEGLVPQAPSGGSE